MRIGKRNMGAPRQPLAVLLDGWVAASKEGWIVDYKS